MITDTSRDIVYLNPHEFYVALLVTKREGIKNVVSDLRIPIDSLSVLLELQKCQDIAILVSLTDEDITAAFAPLLTDLVNNPGTHIYPDISESIIHTIAECHPMAKSYQTLLFREISSNHTIIITTGGISVYKYKEYREVLWNNISEVKFDEELESFIFHEILTDYPPLRISKLDLINENAVDGFILTVTSLIIGFKSRNTFIKQMITGCSHNIEHGDIPMNSLHYYSSELVENGLQEEKYKIYWKLLLKSIERFFGVKIEKTEYSDYGTRNKVPLSYLAQYTRILICKYQVLKIVQSYISKDVPTSVKIDILIDRIWKIYNIQMIDWQFESILATEKQDIPERLTELITAKLLNQPLYSDSCLLYVKDLERICRN